MARACARKRKSPRAPRPGTRFAEGDPAGPADLIARVGGRTASSWGTSPRGVLQPSVSRDLRIDLFESEALDHGSNRELRVVGPEHSQIFAGLIVVTNALAVFVGKCFAIAKIGRPAQECVTEIEL